MHTPICDELGIEFPIFAFTHCRDVVVAVSKAGGFGVLGAVGFTSEQLEIELKWIDENIGDHPYGVDIVIPNKYEGMDSQLSAEDLAETLRKMVPQEHLDFGKKILADHGVPVEDSDGDSLQLLGWTEATATPQVEVALQHPKVKMIANALGTPPAEMIKHIHDAGLKVAALCGSQWLMVEESSNPPVQQAAYVKAGSRDTVRSRSFTGKPARMLRNDWTEAWEAPDNPKPLGMPLQYMVSGMAVRATNRYPNESVDVAFNPVGQVVGQFSKVEKTSTVIERWVQEYLEATNRLDELNEAATV